MAGTSELGLSLCRTSSRFFPDLSSTSNELVTNLVPSASCTPTNSSRSTGKSLLDVVGSCAGRPADSSQICHQFQMRRFPISSNASLVCTRVMDNAMNMKQLSNEYKTTLKKCIIVKIYTGRRNLILLLDQNSARVHAKVNIHPSRKEDEDNVTMCPLQTQGIFGLCKSAMWLLSERQ